MNSSAVRDRWSRTILNDGANIKETIQVHESNAEATAPIETWNGRAAPATVSSGIGLVDELDGNLHGLHSFFNSRNHPLAEQERRDARAIGRTN